VRAGFVFARGGSKGLPGKNLLLLGGKPLVQRAVECLLESGKVDRVFVSTDDAEIESVALRSGADESIRRPSELASDTSSELDAWKHALRVICDRHGDFPSLFVSAPATAPLRMASDIELCVDTLLGSSADLAVCMTPAVRNPWFSMVKRNESGFLSTVITDVSVQRRQDAPECWDLTCVAYAAHPSYILATNHLFSGNVIGAEVGFPNSLDVDTAQDFAICEMFVKQAQP
jgi:N,N'-diacetyl-8-epilegionaminate cytidylyltransferase